VGDFRPGVGANPRDSLEGLLLRARNGDVEAREELLRLHLPLVLRTAARLTGRHVKEGQDDEVSVGLMALNEAVDAYDFTAGMSFANFGEMVVRRRLIDFLRKKGDQEMPLSAYEVEDEEGARYNPVEEREAVREHEAQEQAADVRAEIEAYAKALASYGLSFAELPEISPRRADARRRAREVARIVAENEGYARYLREHKRLPLKALARVTGVPRKTLERLRKYIIAIAVIHMEGLEILRDYVRSG